MARTSRSEPDEGFQGKPSDCELSIYLLAQAFASVMGTGEALPP